MMILGFCVATAGHIWRLRWLIVIGIALITLATFLLPLALIATSDQPPPPDPVIPSSPP
jgi:hypothetical protein